jgi:hypothetical protein
MKNRMAVFGCVMCIMLAAVFVQVSQAQTWDKRTVITVNKPWSLPGNTVLQPGTYVMRLYDSPNTRRMVEVWNCDETKLEARVIGLADYRLEPTNDTVLNFYERKNVGPAALQSWFYPGDLSGVEFPAPPSVAQDLAYVEIKAPEVAPPAVAEAPAPPPEPPQPEVAPQPEPPQIVENVPPPAPQPVPELPRTASDAPVVVLIGLISLAGAVLFRSLIKS